MDSDRLLTSHEVGQLLQVNPTSVNKWVNDGRIIAFRTPGGHRRIRLGDLIRFLHDHKIPVPAPLLSRERRRLLIVDDDQRYLRSLSRALKRHQNSIETICVDNGVDALVAVGTQRPHLILLDLLMPGIDGLEVCRRLKANPDTQNIDIILSSGHLTPANRAKALEAGAQATLAKPVDLERLLDELHLRAAVATP